MASQGPNVPPYRLEHVRLQDPHAQPLPEAKPDDVGWFRRSSTVAPALVAPTILQTRKLQCCDAANPRPGEAWGPEETSSDPTASLEMIRAQGPELCLGEPLASRPNQGPAQKKAKSYSARLKPRLKRASLLFALFFSLFPASSGAHASARSRARKGDDRHHPEILRRKGSLLAGCSGCRSNRSSSQP
jgi:hypothetical protein